MAAIDVARARGLADRSKKKKEAEGSPVTAQGVAPCKESGHDRGAARPGFPASAPPGARTQTFCMQVGALFAHSPPRPAPPNRLESPRARTATPLQPGPAISSFKMVGPLPPSREALLQFGWAGGMGRTKEPNIRRHCVRAGAGRTSQR